MHLDRDDEKMLHGEYGETRQKMMEILVALGKVFGADRLIPITSAQVSGASYKTIGDWGLQWLESLQAKVAVLTVLNPVGMPRDGWEDIGISRDFAEKQNAIIEAYRHLGVKLECTCTPYYLHLVKYGEHLAWAESSAVVYANSVIGARTNREGGPSALAAAIVGKTPDYGLHRIVNRYPSIAFTLESSVDRTEREDIFSAIGYIAGRKAGTKIPLFHGIRPRKEELKSLGAAMAATGAVSIFHVEGLTPEARIFKYDSRYLETITIERSEIDALFGEMDVDAVAIGCPHCSPDELRIIARLLKGMKVTKPLFIFASREVIRTSKDAVDVIIQSGAKVVPDTCMVVSPFMEQYRSIMVDSGKALAYVPSMCGALARLGTREECITVATSKS